jgi:hypothetical protein
MTERRKEDRRELAAMIIGILLVLGSVLYVHTLQARVDRETRIQGDQHTQLVEACRRLQIVRVEDNVSHYADYRVFRVVLQEQLAALKQGKVPQSQLANAQRFIAPLAMAVNEKTWVPVTDCARAVNEHGLAYPARRPVPFVKRLPSKADLTLPAADFR